MSANTTYVLIALVFIFLVIVSIYNQIIILKNRVKNAYAQIEVQLKRRHDLIPNLIDTVKGYMSYEKAVLENITKARSMAMKISEDAKIQAEHENNLSNSLKSFFAVSENYPDLKANQNFLKLQEELISTENKIGFARQFYNDAVMQYNTKKEIFPNNIICSIFKFETYSMFEIENSKEKEAVKVDIN